MILTEIYWHASFTRLRMVLHPKFQRLSFDFSFLPDDSEFWIRRVIHFMQHVYLWQ